MNFVQDILGINFLGNSIAAWISALLIFVLLVSVLKFLQSHLLSKMCSVLEAKKNKWPIYAVSALQSTSFIVLCVVGIRAGISPLELSPKGEKFFVNLLVVALFAQIGLWANAFYSAWYKNYRESNIKGNPAAVTTLDATKILVRIFIWLSIFLLIFNNLGFNVTAFVTGLGIGGVAIALAVQKILGDILASLAIVTDKPFAVGDFIILGEYMGAVENIGLKTTRIRSLSGEQIIFSNSDLLASRVRNYGRMFERRIEVTIGVTYTTSRENIVAIPNIIKQAINGQDHTRFDRAHFKAYAESSLDFQYVYYVLSPDYNLYMDIQQAVNLKLHEEFEKSGIDFAFPSRTVYVKPAVAQPASGQEVAAIQAGLA